MHVCNKNIKQKGHHCIFTLLLQYTTHTAVIFTYLFLPQYSNLAVPIHKISVTKHQSVASFGIFVFKLPYNCNIINQLYSSCLNIWRERVTSLKKTDGKPEPTEAHTIYNKNCTHALHLTSVKKQD
jgi:hypothetical protein